MIDFYKKTKETEFDNGFIYPISNRLISILIKVNLVEVFKKISEYIVKKIYTKSGKGILDLRIRKARNFSIDLFIICKFIFVLLLWKYNISNIFSTIITIYLLFMNVFTYFYYHIWDKNAILNSYLTVNRVRRRFLNLFISFVYMIISYGYLYECVYNYCFKVDNGLTSINYFMFSLSNSFSNSYDKIKAINNTGDFLRLSQIVITFLFITIILACSMPRANKE